MDDRTFDEQTAAEWIGTIERAGNPRHGDVYPRLRAWIAKASPRDVLEIGCGQGACSAELGAAELSYVGLEPSQHLRVRAEKLFGAERRRFVAGNAYRLPVADSSFDAVFSISVWHLLEDIAKAARELARALRTDGRFLIVTANPGGYDEWVRAFESGRLMGRRFEGDVKHADGSKSLDVLYLHPLDEIRATLTEAGLAVDSVETFRKAARPTGAEMFVAISGSKSRSLTSEAR